MVWQRPIGTCEIKTQLWREQGRRPASGTGHWEGLGQSCGFCSPQDLDLPLPSGPLMLIRESGHFLTAAAVVQKVPTPLGSL